MKDDAKEVDFPDDICSYHYINPCPSGSFAIPGDLEEGDQIVIEGHLNTSPKKFSLKFGANKDDASAKHFSYTVNIGQSVSQVVTYSQDKQLDLEKSQAFQPGMSVRMKISTKTKKYQVKINNDPSTSYYINDTSKPRYIFISGDLYIRILHINKTGPQTKDVFMTIPDNAQIGDIYTFRGKGAKDKQRIVIDFMKGYGEEDNVYFHFNPRFGWEGWKIIVRDVFIDKKWEYLCYDKEMPLKENVEYKLDIVVEEKQFCCFINESHFCDFKHRLPFKEITNVKIMHRPKDNIVSEISSVVLTRVDRQAPSVLGEKLAKSISDSGSKCVHYFPSVPGQIKVPCKLGNGSCISVSGIFKDAKQFKWFLINDEGDKIYGMKIDFEGQVIQSLEKEPIQIKKPAYQEYKLDDAVKEDEDKDEEEDKEDEDKEKEKKEEDPAIDIANAAQNEKAAIATSTATQGEASGMAISNASAVTMSSKEDPFAKDKFPFTGKGHFDMQIWCLSSEELCVILNGIVIQTSKPKLDYKLTNYIFFSGEIRIKTVAFLKAEQ